MNNTANDNSGKPDASKVARPVWGWGQAVTPALHHDKNSILSNCHIQVMFPPNRLETAKYISQMLGETTVVERQYSVSGKRAGIFHDQVSESVKTDRRPLLTPDEVMALPGPRKNAAGDIVAPGEMIIRVAGSPPIRGRQPLYFMDEVFNERAKFPPPEDTDRIGVELTEKTSVKEPEEAPGGNPPDTSAVSGEPSGEPPKQSAGMGNEAQRERTIGVEDGVQGEQTTDQEHETPQKQDATEEEARREQADITENAASQEQAVAARDARTAAQTIQR